MARVIDALVKWIVLPVTNVIPILASTGILLIAFAALWLAFMAAIVISPDVLTDAWRWLGSWWLPLQAVVWVLFLPLMVGLWIWTTDWPLVLRLLLVVGLAAWNLIVFMPRREAPKRSEATN